jgi:hypothetical protein
MPYDIEKRGGKFCVVKRDDGKSMGCHATEKEARAQMAAIHANEGKSLAVFKGANGLRHMVIVTSNSYKDRENEFISQEAWAEWVAQQWDGDNFVGGNPVLFWHDGPSIGEIVWSNQEGAFLLEIAQERQSGMPMLRHYARALWDYIENSGESWGASHGFTFQTGAREATPDGAVYRSIRKQETSVLPLEWAANLWTFAGVHTMSENQKDAKRGLLERILGKDTAAWITGGLAKAQEQLDAAGVERKAIGPQATREDVIDLVLFTLKGVAETEDDGEQDLRGAVEAQLDALMDVPAVNIADYAAALDVSTTETETEATGADEDEDEPEADKGLDVAALVTKQNNYLGTLVEAQGDLLEAQQDTQKAIKTLIDVLGAQNERIKALETAIGERPRRASRAAETIANDDDERVKEAETAGTGRMLFGRIPLEN